MKKIIILFILTLTASGFSQNIKFEGTIEDSTGVGLDMANIMAVNQETKAMDAYAISNETGKFSLVLKANTAYTIKASYIGFQSYEKTISTGTSNMNYTITLKEGTQLKELEIVYEMPVSISGDTII